MKRLAITLITLSFVLSTLSPTARAELLQRRQCQTVYQGIVIQGMYQIERLHYYQTHRVYGQFTDARRNLMEFEVMTNQPRGGVGGMWFNHAKHRETHIQLRLIPTGFIIHTQDGEAVKFVCH